MALGEPVRGHPITTGIPSRKRRPLTLFSSGTQTHDISHQMFWEVSAYINRPLAKWIKCNINALFFPGLFFLIFSYFCSFLVVWGFGVGVLFWVFGVGVFSWWGLGPVVQGLLGLFGWGSLYKHKIITLEKEMVQFCRPSSSTGWARTLFFRLTTQIDITEFNYLHLYSFLKLFLNVFFFILYVLHKHFAEKYMYSLWSKLYFIN